MKKKLITSILFILLLLSTITIVSATDTTAKYNETENDTGLYIFETSDNETLKAVCLDYERGRPSSQDNENVTYTLTNTSTVDKKIKEAIVKYYRNDSNLTSDELQRLIWKIQGKNINSSNIIDAMYDSLTGTMEIGDTYTYNDGKFIYTFNFYYGIPSNDEEAKPAQRMLLFTYAQENITFDNSTPPTNNSTTNNSTTNNSTKKATTKNVTNNVTTPGVGNTEINIQTSNNSAATNKVSATMKNTGIPINMILVVLVSVLSVLIGRKQN